MGLTRPRAYQIYDIDYKQATRVVTTTNVTLSGGAPKIVDGVTLTLNDRVLVSGQNTKSQNGIYYVTTVGTGSNGTWTRSIDTDTTGELNDGTIVAVTEGLNYADTQWKLTTDDPIIIGTSELVFVNMSTTAAQLSSAVDNFTGDGANVNFTLSVTPSNENLTFVNINGVEQLRSAYTISNNVITFSSAPSVGMDIEVTTLYGAASTITGLTNGTSSVAIPASDGNINLNVGGSTIAVVAAGGEYVTGIVSATGNITGNYFIGNGSLLTGISGTGGGSNIANGTSNVEVVSSGGNVRINIGGTANVAVFATNEIDVAANIIPTSNVTYSLGTTSQRFKDIWLANSSIYLGNVTLAADATQLTINGSNVLTATSTSPLSTTANVTGGNLLTGGLISATSTVTGSSFLGTVASLSGNVTGGNLLTGGLISANGNITGNYLFGNGVSLTGVITSVANINNGTSNVTVVSSGGNIAVSVGGTSNVAVFATTGEYVTGLISATGNVTGANLNATADASIGGNVSVGGYISAVGNLYVTNIVAGNSLTVTDPLVYFQSPATYPYNYDIGFYSDYVGGAGNVYQHAGFIRDYTDNTWKLFSNVIPEPTSTTINLTNAIYDPIQTGNVLVAGIVSASGTITGTSFLGTVVSVSANITGGNILTGGLLSITGASQAGSYSSAGNITGGNLLTSGLISATSTITGSSLLGSVASLSANVTGGNLLTGGLISATSTVTGSSFLGTVASLSGNVTGGNVLTGGLISATGNITGNYILGNGSQLTGIATGTPTAVVNGTTNITTATNGNANITIGGTSNVAVFATTGEYVTGLISASGNIISAANITGGNILTGGLLSITGASQAGSYSTTGNINGANIIASGNIQFTSTGFITTTPGTNGNVNVDADGSGQFVLTNTTPANFGNTLTVTSNVSGGNLLTDGLISATSTITGSSHLGTVTSMSGNVTGGNLLTGGLISAASTITGTSHLGSTVSITGTMTSASTVGGVITGSSVSVTGTATAASTVGGVITGSSASTTGNVTGGNIISVADVSAGASGHVYDMDGDVRIIVQNSNAAATYTLAATDDGKHINYTGASGNVAVPASIFTAGQAVTIYNNQAASITIVQNSGVTMRLAGTATTGNRTLAQYGLSTVMCVAANTFVISGAGLT